MNANQLRSLFIIALCLGALISPAHAQKSDTKNDPSLTPWNDPDDPYLFRLNKKDPSLLKWTQVEDLL